MYEPTHGTPQYTPDERWDSQLTYPLEGNYVRWPRASTPDRWHAPMYSTRQSTKLWCTIAAADALDAREAAKPHRGWDAAACCGAPFAISTYAAEPKDRSETPMPVTCLLSSLPLSSPLSPPPSPRPPPSPPRLPPEREDGGEESYLYMEAPEYLYMPPLYLRVEELDEQDEAESLRIEELNKQYLGLD